MQVQALSTVPLGFFKVPLKRTNGGPRYHGDRGEKTQKKGKKGKKEKRGEKNKKKKKQKRERDRERREETIDWFPTGNVWKHFQVLSEQAAKTSVCPLLRLDYVLATSAMRLELCVLLFFWG